MGGGSKCGERRQELEPHPSRNRTRCSLPEAPCHAVEGGQAGGEAGREAAGRQQGRSAADATPADALRGCLQRAKPGALSHRCQHGQWRRCPACCTFFQGANTRRAASFNVARGRRFPQAACARLLQLSEASGRAAARLCGRASVIAPVVLGS
jgi:hypothetical protein